MQLRTSDPGALDLDAVVGEWAGRLRVLPNAAFAPRSDIGALIAAAAQAFPDLGAFDLEQFTLGACFFSDAVVGYDDVLDYTEERPAQVRDLLGVIPMQFESFRIFGQLLGDKPSFWSDLRRYYVEYLEAMHGEFAVKTDAAAWEGYGERECLRLAAGKNGLVRTVAAALCAAAEDRSKLAALEDVLVDIFVAYQMQDDVHDWREDLRTGQLSTVLRLACPARPSAADVVPVARAIFVGGKAQHVLLHGIALLDSAVPRALNLGAPGLLPLIAARRRMLTSVLDGVSQELQRAPVRRHALQLVVPPAAAAVQEPLRQGLTFLAEHAARGFWETRHWIVLGDGWGTDLPSVVYGDVFARAMVLDALCALREAGVEGLDAIVAADAAYLAGARRRDALGGWSYLPDVQLLPSDADTTAQVVQALARAGRKSDALAWAAPTLELLFARARADGAYATWALPAPELSELDRRRYDIMAGTFGLEPDVDVISNLSYTLHALAHPRFAERVSRSAAFVESAQRATGLWSGTWYEGPYYPTYAAARFLCALAPGETPAAVALAARRLLLDQRADGGWGSGGDGDSLSTALAMNTLALVAPQSPDDMAPALELGVRYLTGRRAADGGWEAVPFVRVFQGQADQASKSRCVTTAYVLRALMPVGAR